MPNGNDQGMDMCAGEAHILDGMSAELWTWERWRMTMMDDDKCETFGYIK
jgi:hypothetical protein